MANRYLKVIQFKVSQNIQISLFLCCKAVLLKIFCFSCKDKLSNYFIKIQYKNNLQIKKLLAIMATCYLQNIMMEFKNSKYLFLNHIFEFLDSIKISISK